MPGRRRLNARMFRTEPIANLPLPPLQPYVRCTCGACRDCKDNEKWDRVFAKFAVANYGEERSMFRSPLANL